MDDGLAREVIEALHSVQRDIAVLTERLSNERDNRDLFAVAYERRHKEVQEETEALHAGLALAESERHKLASEVVELKSAVSDIKADVSGISASIRWLVYLILGLVIAAVVGVALTGKSVGR